ncbi:hypothetical protein D3C72_1242340 [compost metagenome]
MHRGQHAQFDLRVAVAQPAQARHQPARDERAGGRHRHHLVVALAPRLFGHVGQLVEDRSQRGRIALARAGEHHAARQALEQHDAQPRFQLFHVVADGAGRHVQFFARALEAFMAGGGLEGVQGGEWGQGT